jgi:hypothetical protein
VNAERILTALAILNLIVLGADALFNALAGLLALF